MRSDLVEIERATNGFIVMANGESDEKVIYITVEELLNFLLARYNGQSFGQVEIREYQVTKEDKHESPH